MMTLNFCDSSLSFVCTLSDVLQQFGVVNSEQRFGAFVPFFVA